MELCIIDVVRSPCTINCLQNHRRRYLYSWRLRIFKAKFRGFSVQCKTTEILLWRDLGGSRVGGYTQTDGEAEERLLTEDTRGMEEWSGGWVLYSSC